MRDSGPLAQATAATAPRIRPPGLADPLLALAADVLDDLEKVRIANENRLRQLTRGEDDVDKDGGTGRGFGLDLTNPAVSRVAAIVRMMKCDSAVVLGLTGEKALKKSGCCLEHDAERNLTKALRDHPLGPWIKAQKGIGEKQGARLLAAIGDPYIRPEIMREDGVIELSRPRTVSELWAYTGYHVIKTPVSGQSLRDPQKASAADGSTVPAGGQRLRDAHGSPAAGGELDGGDPGQAFIGTQVVHAGVAPKRQRGARANWSATAKMRGRLVAESCMKAGGPYREVYDKTRLHYADAIHEHACVQCGPKGKPAEPGSPLSDGHKHARALRKVAKDILRDLWREARRLHEEA